MKVLDYTGQYFGFPYTTVKVTDNTYINAIAPTSIDDVPDFNMLIPICTPAGLTNTLELYRPGTADTFVANHGVPNAIKYGFGPSTIYAVLDRPDSNVGVYTINVRGADAASANIALIMKYKVLVEAIDITGYTPGSNVVEGYFGPLDPADTSVGKFYEDQACTKEIPLEGGKVYQDLNWQSIYRPVLHVKWERVSFPDIAKWPQLHKALSDQYNDTPDDDGYKTLPWFGVLYRGATSYANDMYFNMVPSVASYDGKMYYTINLFNGNQMITTDPVYSLDPASGAEYGTTNYIENRFNDTFGAMKFLTATPSDEIKELFSQYLQTEEELIAAKDPSIVFADVDVFTAEYGANRTHLYCVAIDEEFNSTDTKAFQLANGTDGTEDRDTLFKKFFSGEILPDIVDPLRYRANYIPDIGYDMGTKEAIKDLIDARIRMTVATFTLGSMGGSFSEANIEHTTKWNPAAAQGSMPCIRQIAGAQSPMRYDEHTRRTMTFPAGYYDTIALVEHFARCGDFYQPFAGADARWTDYEEDTMVYPGHSNTELQGFFDNRINVAMKDWMPGCYMSDQLMNTKLQSDQTEFNNALLITNLLYDLIRLIHANHFKFNEPEHVRAFGEAVSNMVSEKYARYSVNMTATVQRVGTVGRARMTNKITVTIDFLDINRYTDVELILTDE